MATHHIHTHSDTLKPSHTHSLSFTPTPTHHPHSTHPRTQHTHRRELHLSLCHTPHRPRTVWRRSSFLRTHTLMHTTRTRNLEYRHTSYTHSRYTLHTDYNQHAHSHRHMFASTLVSRQLEHTPEVDNYSSGYNKTLLPPDGAYLNFKMTRTRL